MRLEEDCDLNGEQVATLPALWAIVASSNSHGICSFSFFISPFVFVVIRQEGNRHSAPPESAASGVPAAPDGSGAEAPSPSSSWRLIWRFGNPFHVLVSSKKIAEWFGVKCEDCPEDTVWGCYVTKSCWKVVMVNIGFVFVLVGLLLCLFFLGQIDDVLSYQRRLAEYESNYPTLAKLLISPLKSFHKGYVKAWERGYKSLEKRHGKKLWFAVLVMLPCKLLKVMWRIGQKCLQPTCGFCWSFTSTCKHCIKATGLFQSMFKKGGCMADPEGDARRAKETKKQAKLDAKKAKKQVMLEAIQDKKLAEEAANHDKTGAKEAKEERNDEEGEESYGDAEKGKKADKGKKEDKSEAFATPAASPSPSASSAPPSPPSPATPPWPVPPPGMSPGAMAPVAVPPQPLAYGAQTQYGAQYGTQFAAYEAFPGQAGYEAYNNPMYGAEQYGQGSYGVPAAAPGHEARALAAMSYGGAYPYSQQQQGAAPAPYAQQYMPQYGQYN
ncbi:uncharacterized protein [Physcomitrium patens]|uniref:uncharacterized protein n=1 Tax=Physcomitrium patens TaxID=3218 RepID=UPI000D177523|nr:uncharacterized protein LOC112273189 [Physcomitrium patens]|eukprot:XP_024357436.1 uncharacterized protein LOC112273189 [Physcomitrella patens]